MNSYSSLAAVYVRLPVHLLWREALAESTSRGVTYGSTRGVYAVYCYGLTLHVGMCTPRTSDASSELPRSRRSARVHCTLDSSIWTWEPGDGPDESSMQCAEMCKQSVDSVSYSTPCTIYSYTMVLVWKAVARAAHGACRR